MAPFIKLTGLSKHFDDVVAIDDLSLEIDKGELFCLLGASGCGKSTLLRLLAGFETPTAGRIEIDGHDMAGVGPALRPVNIMFQNYALFPHMTVAANIGYGLRRAGMRGAELDERVKALLALVRMDKLGGRKPHQLSGGQKQLVALLRGLASNPKIILLDEPFANLDTRLREKLRDKVLHILKDNQITSIIVTHDADEAMFLSDYIAILEDGQIQQHGKPVELYTRPKNRFVAEFFGEINVITGKKINNKLNTPLGDFDLNNSNIQENYSLVVRSEGIKIIKSTEDDSLIPYKKYNNLVKSPNNGRIIEAKFLGGSTIVHLALNGMEDFDHLHIKIPGINYFEKNQIVNLYTDVNYSYIFET